MLFLSQGNGALNSMIINWAEENELFRLVSEIKRISMVLALVFFKEPNLFFLKLRLK